MAAYNPIVKSSRFQLIVAFAAVYIIWGSTYLAIRFAVETLPPLIMMGLRFLIGGLIFYGYALVRGETKATFLNWKTAAIIGILMLCGGTGTFGWAETRVPSGLSALMIACVPFWIVVVDWLRPGGSKPRSATTLGLIVGFVGLGILIGPEEFAGSHRVDITGGIALILASLSWATGSIYSRHNHAKLPASQWMSVAMELLIAGVASIAIGALLGETSSLNFSAMSAKSLLALFYLGIFGSLAFAAYIWLLKASTPAKAATYAYVNPLVAVILGATLGSEEFSLRIALASVVIISAVVVITTTRTRQPELPTAELSKSLEGTPRVSSEPS